MLSLEQKLAALQSEQQQIAQSYNNAKQVLANCEKKLLQLQGGIETCEELIKANEKKPKAN